MNMNGSWFFDENFNGVPDDFFDDAMKYFDFPLEDVESNEAGEDWEAKFQHLAPPPSDVLNGFTSVENSNELKIKKSFSNLCGESSQPKQCPSTAEAASSRSIPLKYDLVEAKYSHPFWTTSSPVSVLESSSSSSSAENPTVYHPKLDIPVKRPRSKRPRPQRRAFPFISLAYVSKQNHPLESSESQSQSETHSEETMLNLFKKNQQKRRNLMLLSSSEETKKPSPSPQQKPAEIRKCTHCEVTKTPQWREGPMGPKTLCNACGVRYRSGRLFPEYRPAASPTFVPTVHSNSHRKVIEMRKTGMHGSATAAASDGYPPPCGSEYSF